MQLMKEERIMNAPQIVVLRVPHPPHAMARHPAQGQGTKGQQIVALHAHGQLAPHLRGGTRYVARPPNQTVPHRGMGPITSKADGPCASGYNCAQRCTDHDRRHSNTDTRGGSQGTRDGRQGAGGGLQDTWVWSPGSSGCLLCQEPCDSAGTLHLAILTTRLTAFEPVVRPVGITG